MPRLSRTPKILVFPKTLTNWKFSKLPAQINSECDKTSERKYLGYYETLELTGITEKILSLLRFSGKTEIFGVRDSRGIQECFRQVLMHHSSLIRRIPEFGVSPSSFGPVSGIWADDVIVDVIIFFGCWIAILFLVPRNLNPIIPNLCIRRF